MISITDEQLDLLEAVVRQKAGEHVSLWPGRQLELWTEWLDGAQRGVAAMPNVANPVPALIARIRIAEAQRDKAEASLYESIDKAREGVTPSLAFRTDEAFPGEPESWMKAWPPLEEWLAWFRGGAA